jgi:hypothetical protein
MAIMSVMSRLQMCTRIPRVTRDRTFGRKSTVTRQHTRWNRLAVTLVSLTSTDPSDSGLLALLCLTFRLRRPTWLARSWLRSSIWSSACQGPEKASLYLLDLEAYLSSEISYVTVVRYACLPRLDAVVCSWTFPCIKNGSRIARGRRNMVILCTSKPLGQSSLSLEVKRLYGIWPRNACTGNPVGDFPC